MMFDFATFFRNRDAVKLKKIGWTLNRFGLTPNKLRFRFVGNDIASSLLLNSIPKSGTHLLEIFLCSHPQIFRAITPTIYHSDARLRGNLKLLENAPSGFLLVGHLPKLPEYEEILRSKKFLHVFLARDPRDILISFIHHSIKDSHLPFHQHLLKHKTLGDQIKSLFDLNDGKLPFDKFLMRYADWGDKASFVTRYEELTDWKNSLLAEGKLDPRLISLLELIGVKPTEDYQRILKNELGLNRSPTFRKGKSSQWHESLSVSEVDFVNQRLENVLVKFGYT
jgi:sulfotransferase 6B1